MCAAEVDRHVAQRYLIKRRLGKGAYGIVWKAVDRRTGDVVAIKKIFDAFRDQTDAQRTFREVMLLQEFGNHPNIIRLLDVIPAQNDKDIYLVFESMDTDLNAVIQKGKLLEDIHKRCIFYQLLRATKFIHSGRVIHRDQKPANVLLDAACRVKLCDFGLARSLSDLPEGPEGQALTEYVATRWYRAPEVLLSSRWYTPGVDMWSLGCILGEMLRGQPLFPGTSTFHQLELILETIPLPSMEELQALGSDYSALILQNLGSKPRQTLDALLPPDTPPEALDLLKRLLAFAPDKRLSAEQALQHPYVQRFHCPDREWTRGSDVRLPVHERDQLSAPEYRNRLYQMILERRGNSRSPGEEGLRGAASRPELRVSPARAQSLKPGVLPQVPAETPARKRGPRPQSSPDHTPEHVEVPRQSSDPLLQLPPPSRGERPPGATAEPPSAPSGAAAQAANQALIRSDPARGGGPRAAGARRVSPALPSSLQCGSYPPEPCSTPLPPEQDPRLRAGPFPPAPGGPGTPTRPKDVWHLGLAGGPGRSQSCAWRLLPGLWDRVPLGAGPPAPAPRTACVSRPPASSRQPGAVPQPPAHLPPLSICIRVPGGFPEPLSPKGE
ncbi:mitogen-activated protein kinase 15 isoform X2 [Peromyscus eremicus]|uniref:mitogen-activated protein kinase 15 isoform X2 n=1 Tax=Peromyscus eremicus TaxID=42410 RepID=UPI0027DC3E45|nr:mitogen-activated protein kinase 15 isoform X2 [Peromyscus eremicus]